MIRKIRIQNFKSIHDLTLDLGRVNVFIGENGSGKSNILEAVAMGAAGESNDVSNLGLINRGLRITSSEHMFLAFSEDRIIRIILSDSKNEINHELSFRHDNLFYSEWNVIGNMESEYEYEKQNFKNFYDDETTIKKEVNKETYKYIKSFLNILKTDDSDLIASAFSKLIVKERYSEKLKKINLEYFKYFTIFAPENYFLRKFEEDTSILGIRGEGLFKLISVTAQESPEKLQKIKKCLGILLNWFDDFEIPDDLFSNERRLHIRDRYLKETLHAFDQRSANEGFLYLLFYFTLFISEYTPKFFAIDNLDNALNPRLCAELMRTLAKLAAEHDKQCLITTHNPAVLDGLDLTDDEQRLFVVSRNLDGHTQIRRVEPPRQIPGVESTLRLSERFIRGFIGGVPTNF